MCIYSRNNIIHSTSRPLYVYSVYFRRKLEINVTTYPRHCLIFKVFISGHIRKQLLAHALTIVRCMNNLEDKAVRTISGVLSTLLPSLAPDAMSYRISSYYLLSDMNTTDTFAAVPNPIEFDYHFMLGKFNEIEIYRRHNMITKRFFQ